MCFNDTSAKATGRVRCVLLLAMSVALSLVFQYMLAPELSRSSNNYITKIPKLSTYLINAWDCGNSGNFGVYRVCATTTIFFLLSAIGAKIRPTMNREAWPAKYFLFLTCVVGSIFVPVSYFEFYVPFARALAALFIIVQQVILIDVAYNWNDSWVERSNVAEYRQTGAGVHWLRAIVVSCIALFLTAFGALRVMYDTFVTEDATCSANRTFLGITLGWIILATVVQMGWSQTGLLTSAVLSFYATYLAYSAMTKNPYAACNPTVHEEQNLVDIVMGVALTFVSLAWTGWAFTSDDRLSSRGVNESIELSDHRSPLLSGERSIGGLVATSEHMDGDGDDDVVTVAGDDEDAEGLLWKLNLVLACVSAWVAMTLTGWNSFDSDNNVSNPDKSSTNMWIIIVSQWVAMTLYLWTLMAPVVFPDRDFS